MTKTIIKEIGIVLLLLIAIILIFAIIFYDYIPSNKTVPIKIQAYNMPEDIQNELADAFTEGENIVKTFYIDSTDLDSYESTNDYDKGKANPFADYSEESTNTTQNNTDTNNTTNSNSSNDDSNNSQNGNEDSDGEVYMNTPGKNY